MVFLFESNLEPNKKLFLELTQIFGLGKCTAHKICKKAGFSKNLRIKNLCNNQLGKLIKLINNINLVGNNLKKFQFSVFREKLNLKLIKSIRKLQGLPVRGQRTHTNAKNSKKQKVAV